MNFEHPMFKGKTEDQFWNHITDRSQVPIQASFFHDVTCQYMKPLIGCHNHLLWHGSFKHSALLSSHLLAMVVKSTLPIDRIAYTTMVLSVYLGSEPLTAYGLTQVGGLLQAFFLALRKPCPFVP